MSIFGKILLFLNILTALGFFWLAGMDYGKRHTWSFAAFQHDLAIDGLPLDAKEKDPDGVPIIDRIPQKYVETLGLKKKTQVEEFQDYKNSIGSRLSALPDDGARRALLGRLLAAQATSLAEREIALLRGSDDKVDVNALKTDLEQKFDAAIPKDPNEKNVADRKRGIAEVLFNFAPENASADDHHKRVISIVGVKAFDAAANARAAHLATMSDRQRETATRELKDFEVAYKDVLQELEERKVALKKHKDFLKDQKILLEKHTTLVTERQAEVEQLKKTLEAARVNTQKALALQQEEEKKLFELQGAIARAAKQNSELERQIRLLEQGER